MFGPANGLLSCEPKNVHAVVLRELFFDFGAVDARLHSGPWSTASCRASPKTCTQWFCASCSSTWARWTRGCIPGRDQRPLVARAQVHERSDAAQAALRLGHGGRADSSPSRPRPYSAAFLRCTSGPACCRFLARSTAKPADQFQRTKALLCFKWHCDCPALPAARELAMRNKAHKKNIF